ncbi:CIS tube protein [Hyalangium gracile]|uniref:CIS tube protein n=1 Tax=Hyalangium gracile TaxID=394092 RepID=UPI001CCEF015|nr:LysM peptidoglycan-binding domain-containing protein [Hyalangium gracile]
MTIQRLSSPAASLLSSGSLQKLKILHETRQSDVYAGEIHALFNPSELRYEQNVAWKVSPILAQAGLRHVFEFETSEPATLSLDLFFDTYEGAPSSGALGGLGKALTSALVPVGLPRAPSATDVVKYTDQVVELARVNRELHRPPFCKLMWGQYLLLRGVLTHLNQTFTHFMADGTPVRATLSCTFQHVPTAQEMRARELHSADVAKKRIVRRGDTLSSIAHEEYSDTSQWRAIARANGIEDPRRLEPGRVLTIPPLRK